MSPEDLYRQHGSGVYRYLVGVLGRRADAEDVLQIVWTEMLTRWNAIEAPDRYLWRTARRQAQGYRRKLWRRWSTGIDLETLPETANPGVSPEERWALAKALKSLPFDQREAVVLIALEGCSAREASVRLGSSESTVDSRYRLALSKLRKKLKPTKEKP